VECEELGAKPALGEDQLWQEGKVLPALVAHANPGFSGFGLIQECRFPRIPFLVHGRAERRVSQS
jgi:hypothetical protein